MLFKVHKQLTQTINSKKQTLFSLFLFEINALLYLQTFGKASYLTGTHFISESLYCFSTGKTIIFHFISFIVKKYKTAHFQNFKKLKTANISYPDFVITTVKSIFQCSYSAITVLIQFIQCL